jgi:hypothetical protein
MSATITLPFSLRVRLGAIRWRVRLLRAVRGLALLVVVLGFLAAAAVLVDFWLDLPALTRQIIFSTWLIAGAACLLRSVIVPLGRRIDAAALAAVIEEKYPDLGERLSSAVELAGAPAEGHGSPLLISLLLEEAAVQCERLDFGSAVPARRAGVFAALAAMTVVLIAVPALVWPQPYGELVQRFFSPWDIARAEAAPDNPVTPPAPAIVPVELAADSPSITIAPPAYARAVKEEETYHGLVDLAPLQHSEIRFHFRFSRPAAAACLEEGRGARDEGREKTIRHSLTLSADRQAASLTMTAIEGCKCRLILEAEHNTRTELPGGTIRITPDQPPSVQRFSGPKKTRGLLPYDRVPLEIEAADDIGVAGIELEYRVNDGESVRQPLKLQGGNTPSAVARHVLELAGKVQEDDRFSYRFRVSDNLPKAYKGPHVVIYPPDRWLTLQIARRGDSLTEQEILTQRDEIDRRLQAIREALLQEKRAVYKVQQETINQVSLPPEQRENVQRIERDNRTSQKELREAAALADAPPSETPDPPAALQPVAELAREVADQELDKTQKALEQALKQPSPPERLNQLKTAEEQLASAVKRLEELKKTNRRLAQDRLDQAKLQTLAQREKHLAEQAAELAAKHPVLDPKARELAEKLKRDQAEALGELERLAQKSEPLKQALQKAREDEAQKLAKRARELAQSQRDLAKEETEAERKRQADRFAELARKQRELARQEEELAKKTRPAAPAAQTEPLKPEASGLAADALQQGKAADAIRHQDQAVNDLERLAQAFGRAAKASADPKEEARQLKRAEKALRQRVQEEAAKKNDKQPLSERLKPLEEEQQAIRRAAEQLPAPPNHAESSNLKRQIGERAGQAAEALRKKDTVQAQAHMEETKNLLQRLSDSLPGSQQRQQRSSQDKPKGLPRKEQSEQARQLAQKQRELREEVRRAEQAARSERPTAPQQALQRRLHQGTGELSRQFQRLAQETRNLGPTQAALQRATDNSRQAQQAMQQARDQAQRGEAAAEKQSQERAAQHLDRAARAVAEAARPRPSQGDEVLECRSNEREAGQAAAQAGRQMADAQGQLNRGQTAQAHSTMRQAAQLLAQAAQQMTAAPAGPPRSQAMIAGRGRQAGGLPDLSAYGLDKAAYAGKSWGELPGELRTKIVQDIKARYGDDYARMIKSYFEQIADTKKK